MAVVTLPGSSGGIVTVQSGSGDHIFVAQIIANSILLASVGGGGGTDLNPPVTVSVGSGVPVIPPASTNGLENILYLSGSGGGSLTIPTGYNYVVDLMTGPETITGSNVQIIGFDSAGSTYALTGTSSIAADPAGDESLSVTGTANLATGDGDDTITLIGAGTIDGGAGTNTLSAAATAGGGGIRVQADGTGDIVSVNAAFGGTTTVIGSGSGISGSVFGDASVFAMFSGASDTFFGGTGTTDVTTSGSNALIVGGTGPLSAVDTGTADTVYAGFAVTTAVTADGSGGTVYVGNNPVSVDSAGINDTIVGGSTGAALAVTSGSGFGLVVYNNANALNFVGGDGSVTIVGGTGDQTVAGGAGGTTLFGGTGAMVTYTGTTGNLDFAAGLGNETLDASGSSTNNLFWGSQTPLTADTLIGGTGNDTFVGGAGTDSLVGNIGSHDWFVFIAANGGAAAADTVTGFSSNSEVWLANYGAIGQATTSATTVGSDTTLTLKDGTTITFTGVTSASELTGHIISN